MLTLQKTAPEEGVELLEREPPKAPGPGEVLVDVAAVGLCGSDLHAIAWAPGYAFMQDLLPLTLGHEFAGTVSKLGPGVSDFVTGARVVCWPTVSCGRCVACQQERPQDCQSRRIIGLHRDGAFASQVLVPATNLFRVPAGLSLETAALTEPLAVAVHAVDTAQVTGGDKTLVLGPGPIGLFAAWVAQQRGGEVALFGYEDHARLTLARDLGLATVDLVEESFPDAVQRLFAGPVDRVIEATGRPQSVSDGLDVLRSSGILVTAGIHAEPLMLDLTRFVRMKQQLRAAHDTTSKAFQEAIHLLAEHETELGRVATHRLPLSQARTAIALARQREAVKVVLLPGPVGTAGT